MILATLVAAFQFSFHHALIDQARSIAQVQAGAKTSWWRGIDSWDSAGKATQIISLNAFLTPSATRSAVDDLGDSLIGVLKGDADLSCRFPTKLRYLRSLSESLPWLKPYLAFQKPCEAFEAWADLHAIQSVEALLASGSDRSAMSWFGHLMIRVVYDQSLSTRGPGFDRYFQMAVPESSMTEASRESVIVSGMTGRYAAALNFEWAYQAERRHLGELGRHFKRFQFKLSSDQTRALLERLWEGLFWGQAFRYYFMSQNCATLMSKFLTPAFEPGVTLTSSDGWFVPPGRELRKMTQDLGPSTLQPILPDNLAASERAYFSKSQLPSNFVGLESDPVKRFEAIRSLPRPRSAEDFRPLIHWLEMEHYDSWLKRRFAKESDARLSAIQKFYANLAASTPEASLEAYRDIETQWEQKEQADALSRSTRIHGSTSWPVRLGGGFGFESEGASSHSRLFLSTALISEKLGEQSLFSGNESGELRIMDGSFYLKPTSSPFHQMDLIVFQYVNLSRDRRIFEDSWTQRWAQKWRLLLQKSKVNPGRTDLNFGSPLSLRLWSGIGLADHLVFEVGPDFIVNVQNDSVGPRALLGFPLGLQARQRLTKRIHATESASLAPHLGWKAVQWSARSCLGFEYHLSSGSTHDWILFTQGDGRWNRRRGLNRWQMDSVFGASLYW